MIDDEGFDSRWLGKAIPARHWHFHRRLFGRYGIILAPGEFSQMLKDIASGKALLVQRRSAGSAIYMIRNARLWERYFVLVRNGQIKTALPPSRALKRLRGQAPA
jgi:hypothetical protein